MVILNQNLFLIIKIHLEVSNKPIEHKGFASKIVWFFLQHISKRMLLKLIELLAQHFIVSELQENMARCTTSTSIAAVNSKHERVRVEYRMEITVRRNPLT